MSVYLLSRDLAFPPARFASESGLLAVGGDLSVPRLLLAYQMGIFQWYSEEEPIMWWSPDPRLVLYPEKLLVSRSLQKVIRQKRFSVSLDQSFGDVIRACAREGSRREEGTWITDEMIAAYQRLHEAGYAHSVEVWRGRELAGGLYGVSLGKVFFGESMFTRISNASKVALVALAEQLAHWEFELIDCQQSTNHLKRLGALEIPRGRFLDALARTMEFPTRRGKWDMAGNA
jgi:leucyl/phenylalanyl-tRNA---protein transferase